MKNPNATLTGGVTGIGTLVVWLLGRFHVSLSAEDGSIIAGGAAAVVLWIGRDGLAGIWNRILHGKQPTP